MLGGIDPPKLDELHHLTSHQAQKCLLLLVKVAWLVVKDGDRTKRVPFRRLQQGSCVEPEMRLRKHKSIIAELFIDRGVRHYEWAARSGVRTSSFPTVSRGRPNRPPP